MAGPVSKLGWKIVGGGAAAAAGAAAGKAVALVYRAVRDEDPPTDPAHPDTAWAEALVWAAASGAAIALGRLAAERLAARGWVRTLGSLPPGMGDGDGDGVKATAGRRRRADHGDRPARLERGGSFAT